MQISDDQRRTYWIAGISAAVLMISVTCVGTLSIVGIAARWLLAPRVPADELVRAETLKLIRPHFKSPTSVAYSDPPEVRRLNSSNGVTTWEVNGEVDAANAYNALLRGRVSAWVRYRDSGRKWDLDFVRLDDELLYASPSFKERLDAFFDEAPVQRPATQRSNRAPIPLAGEHRR